MTLQVINENQEKQPSNVIEATSGLLIEQSAVVQIAARIVHHYRGKVAGGYKPVTQKEREITKKGKGGIPSDWRKTLDQDGNEIIMKPVASSWSKGDLLFQDAIYITEKYMSMRINPMGKVHLWYQDGQIIDYLDYSIRKGWAEQGEAFSTEFVEMSADEREQHGLEPKDIGVIAYNILDRDKVDYAKYFLEFSKLTDSTTEGKRLALDAIAKSKGVGIVKNSDTISKKGFPIPPPKGRSWHWVAEKRALTDAVQRSHGDITPAQVMRFANQNELLESGDIPALLEPGFPADAPPEAQQRYIEMHRITQKVERGESEIDWQGARDLMRDNGDDDPLLLEPEADNGLPEDSSSVWWPDLNEFKEACINDFRKPWSKIEKLLGEICGFSGEFDPATAVEMYEALDSYLASNGDD